MTNQQLPDAERGASREETPRTKSLERCDVASFVALRLSDADLGNAIGSERTNLATSIRRLLDEAVRFSQAAPPTPPVKRYLVHEAYMGLLKRAREYDDKDWDSAQKFERHAINAALDLQAAEARIKELESRLSDSSPEGAAPQWVSVVQRLKAHKELFTVVGVEDGDERDKWERTLTNLVDELIDLLPAPPRGVTDSEHAKEK